MQAVRKVLYATRHTVGHFGPSRQSLCTYNRSFKNCISTVNN